MISHTSHAGICIGRKKENQESETEFAKKKKKKLLNDLDLDIDLDLGFQKKHKTWNRSQSFNLI